VSASWCSEVGSSDCRARSDRIWYTCSDVYGSVPIRRGCSVEYVRSSIWLWRLAVCAETMITPRLAGLLIRER